MRAICGLLLAAITAFGSVTAHSQSAPPALSAAPPVKIDGWRYTLRPNDVHHFDCGVATCVPGSRVSYRFYDAGSPMTIEQFGREQEEIVRLLEARAAAGTRITIIGIEGDRGTNVPRAYVSRRLRVAPDASREYESSGFLHGSKASASLISSSRDEKAAAASYARFAQALRPVIHPLPARTK